MTGIHIITWFQMMGVFQILYSCPTLLRQDDYLSFNKKAQCAEKILSKIAMRQWDVPRIKVYASEVQNMFCMKS